MSRRELLLGALGVAFVAAGLLFGLGEQPTWSWTAGVSFGGFVLVLLGLIVGGLKIRGSLDGSGDDPGVSWAPDDSFAAPAPERSDRDPSLSSDELATVIERAGVRARNHGTVADGLELVRPPLREALGEALVAGGRTREAAEAALENGSWTDDRLAASVLEPSVRPPDRSLRERIRAWLFPERVARDRVRRTVNAVAEAADEALPTVPGQSAPRTTPVLQPRLEALRRGADGSVQRAVDPMATARGPRPPEPRLAADDEGEGEGENEAESEDDTEATAAATTADSSDSGRTATAGGDDRRGREREQQGVTER